MGVFFSSEENSVEAPSAPKKMAEAADVDKAVKVIKKVVLEPDTSTFTEITVDASLKEENFDKSSTTTLIENLEALGATKVESVFDPEITLVKPTPCGKWAGLAENGFMTAIRTAYSSHVPLMLSPDHIWTLISQGLSKHIEANAEKFRDKFVSFDGKQIIRLIRDNFVKGKQNDWAGCFDEFSHQIELIVGTEMKDKLCPTFTTTGPVARAVHELGLMDCLKSYFEYRVMTECGISKVRLRGSEADWKQLEESLAVLDELELSDWKEVLAPILDNLRRASAGEATDEHFWTTIYKAHMGGGSGSHPTVDGWSTNFFLYVNDKKRDRDNFRDLNKLYEAIQEQKKKRWSFHNPGVPQKAVPVGVSKTPFIWEYYGKEYPMHFYGGFMGAKFEDGYVSPVLGWAVGEQ